MAIATKTKPVTTLHKKRVAAHHRQSKHYVKSYWPYLPVALLLVGCWQFGISPWHHAAYSTAMVGFMAFAVLL